MLKNKNPKKIILIGTKDLRMYILNLTRDSKNSNVTDNANPSEKISPPRKLKIPLKIKTDASKIPNNLFAKM